MPGIAPAARMGHVHLTVADLARSLEFYERAIGLQVTAREGGRARLGVGDEQLLELTEVPGARPAPRHTGLFHFALLLPSRHDLARWLGHAVKNELELTGASDHLVSEALYLRDPDYHGIEIYRDRPKSEWQRDGDGVKMATLPLDLRDLLATLEDDEPPFQHMAPGTVMGHVHLQVADIPSTEAFYANVVGMDIQARYGGEASFLSAGGYHHHLGANTWNSRGATPAPRDSASLRETTILLPDEEELDRLEARATDAERRSDGAVLLNDPAQNTLVFKVDQKQ